MKFDNEKGNVKAIIAVIIVLVVIILGIVIYKVATKDKTVAVIEEKPYEYFTLYSLDEKVGVVDKNGKYLDSTVIKPFLNGSNQDKYIEQGKVIVKNLIEKYNVDIIAIGNGTASRESEKLVAEVVSEYNERKVEYIIVSEAGASVYSASPLAISEFPDLMVEERTCHKY